MSRDLRSLVALALLLGGAAALDPPRCQAQVVFPTDGMIIRHDTTFAPGTYSLPHGVSIGASNIVLDMNGATLLGTSFKNFGVTSQGHENVTIRNGHVHGYYYGMRLEHGAGLHVENNDLADNWVDPKSLGDSPPFLDINVGPNLGDRTNLGGGLFVNQASHCTITGNVLTGQENGMDLYFVSRSTIGDNDASDNTGWGIHLHASTENVVSHNHADRCTRKNLNDSAGFLLVQGSNGNQILNNTFQYSGDGFFIGNEAGCPSNDNLVSGNDGSYAGANAFEATFSSGNQFLDNIASGSNYGFWLGYSHDGTVVRGNQIRANNVNGVEIEHGQHNVIEGNEIIGNGGTGIVLRTDGIVHFPPDQYPCLDLPDQSHSRFYVIQNNVIHSNYGLGIQLDQTTDSQILNNLVGGNLGDTALARGTSNVWSIPPVPGQNIVGGSWLGGNYWSNYTGQDQDGDGLGDTELPYTNGGRIDLPGDAHPLIGSPGFDEYQNPRVLCGTEWLDVGRNTRTDNTHFDTANGSHLASDGVSLFLLEGNNGRRFDRFDFTTRRYEPRADAPNGVQDGGDLEHAGGSCAATVGIGFNEGDGSGVGSLLFFYDDAVDQWTAGPRTRINGKYYANEALAFDAAGRRLYATIVDGQTGGDPDARRKLAVYDIAAGAWTGFTSAGPLAIEPGSEAECLGGKVYVWQGGFAGAAVNGADSSLLVYDPGTDTWSETPTLQASGVVPGFRTGAFDVWGVSIAADPMRNLLYLTGGERNRQLYVFDPATRTWAAGPTAAYDGGWGSSLEYVAARDAIVQIDGRNGSGGAEGTGLLTLMAGDFDHDLDVDLNDYRSFAACFTGPDRGPVPPGCRSADLDCDDDVDCDDWRAFVSRWTAPGEPPDLPQCLQRPDRVHRMK